MTWIQKQVAQRERALTIATTAKDIFRPICITSKNEIKIEENKLKEALWAPLCVKVNSIPEEYWNQEISKANRELHPYAMEAIYWLVYLNRSYSIRELCVFMGYSPSHNHVKHAIHLLVKFNILIESTHLNGKDIYGLVPSLKKHVISTEVLVETVWKVSKIGWDKICKRKTILTKSKDTKAAKCKQDNETFDSNNNNKEASIGTDAKADEVDTGSTENTVPTNMDPAEQKIYLL